MNYDWIFFDADGTLFDYNAGEAAALNGAFEECGLFFTPEIGTLYREINAGIWREYELGEITQAELKTERFDRLFASLGMTADSEDFSRRYLTILGRQTVLLDGAEEVVAELAGSVGLLLITNGLSEVQRPRFASSSIGCFFPEVVISEELGIAKPDPAIFDHAFGRIGRPAKDRVLMVGDNLGSDILGGANYGIDTCWFNPAKLENGHEVEPDYVIRSLTEIFKITGM
jgi:YjjG family noncanonical pyrimidine nucleotidase